MSYLEFLNDFFPTLGLGIVEVRESEEHVYIFLRNRDELIPLNLEGGGVNRLIRILPEIYECLYFGKNVFIHGLDFNLDANRSARFIIYIRENLSEKSGFLRYTTQESSPLMTVIGTHRGEMFDHDWRVYEIMPPRREV